MTLKRKLTRLLDTWSRGEVDERKVHEKAEEMLEKLSWQKLPRTNPLAAPYEVLSQLDLLNQQWIIPADIPTLKEFLCRAEEDSESAWTAYLHYFDNIDYDARRKVLRDNPYYCT